MTVKTKPTTKLASFSELKPLSSNLTGKYYSRVPDKNISDKLTPGQSMLYSVALSGLKALSPDQESKLSKYEKREITLLANRANRVLNYWKTQVVTNSISVLFNKLFANAPTTSAVSILMQPIVDSEFSPEISFRELGISRIQIIQKLIRHGVLPVDFYNK